jgi:mannose-6-phosphate isomerase-like protein (cupin superfamily)
VFDPGEVLMNVVNLMDRFDQVDQYWSPKIIGELNGQTVKIAKIMGEFIWHQHDDGDEFFLVVKGGMTIKLPQQDVFLKEGEFFIVPRGVQHKPVAQEETLILMFEPQGTLNTGNVRNHLTVDHPESL